MPRKPKTNQSEDIENISGRDLFQTPNYAVDLLVPFLEDFAPVFPSNKFIIWECAAGQGKIVNRLQHRGFDVYGSDLDGICYPKHNFLTQSNGQSFQCIVTNPPFSLKKKFYLQCIRYGVPFALLIPADYSGWIIDAVRKQGAEKIVPTRRVDYVTPSGLSGKGSKSQFHSMWLTWGFSLGKSETFVELTNEMKNNV